MIKFIKTPKTTFTDYYEKARFKLTWNITIVLALFLFLIFCFFLIVEPRFAIHYGIGALFTGAATYWLFIKRKYKGVAKMLTICSYVLVNSSIFFLPNSVHYIEPFWIFIIALYAYFTLGKIWGVSFILANLVSIGLYFVFFLNENISRIQDISLGEALGMTIEFALCCGIIAYIVNQFISTNLWAESELKMANQKVLGEKSIVDKLVKEKTVLLQEIHHRVKNNLQVITSLLRMQSGNSVSDETKKHFDGAINRIMTMSLVHQKMYEKDNLGEINLNEYLSSLVHDLNSSSSSKFQINFDIETSIEKVGMKSIVPLALIVTELVTNSIKHAFNEKDKEPKIKLVIGEIDADSGFFTVNYSDNGKWKPNDETSFGTELIEMLTEQLEGSFDLAKEDSGTTYSFSIKTVDEL